jgi:DNA-binding response OmpR family regulator
MSDPKYRILIAEDDQNLGALITEYIESEGFGVTLCKDGEQALQAFTTGRFDLCLLDVMMPKMDGFTVAKAIRNQDPRIPILFITARSMKEDKSKGYALGADDYITKPFDEEELIWKIRAMVRRIETPANVAQEEVITIGACVFDVKNLCLTLGGNTRRITEKEAHVLKYLSDHRNRVIKREEMVQELWGKNDYFLGRSMDVFLTKIRKYLKEDPAIRIENVFGVGFIFHVPPG